jgi:DNA polymerase III subunit gamma/tau
LSRESGEDYANIALFERDVGGVFGRVVAHIPQLAGILNYDSMLRYGGGNLVVHKKAVKFHWSHVLSLCASLEGVVSSLGADRLLNDLQVRRRQSGPISGPVLEFSGALRATASVRLSHGSFICV